MEKVVVFGSFVVDLMARSPHLPVPGETVRGSLFRMGPGGKGFNQCVAAHKAGAAVTMVTKLGRDAFAEVALDTLSQLKMSSEFIFRSETEATGIAMISVDEHSSQNEIIIVPGACNTFTSEETDRLEPLLRQAGYLLLQLEVNQDANERVAEMAARCGCRIVVNTAPYAPVSDAFLARAYLVTPNEVEAEELSGIPVTDAASAQKAAAFFHRRGVENVLITLGEKGVYLSAPGREVLIPAFSVKAVDTTGAGDAFSGGLLTALAEGRSLEEAVRFASALAALSVQKLGTTPSMPLRAEIDAFLAAHS